MKMKFDEALHHMTHGARAARLDWDEQYLILVQIWDYTGHEDTYSADKLPFLAVRLSDNSIMPWPVSYMDIIEDDWHLVGSDNDRPGVDYD
jgi:hypothetical protein